MSRSKLYTCINLFAKLQNQNKCRNNYFSFSCNLERLVEVIVLFCTLLTLHSQCPLWLESTGTAEAGGLGVPCSPPPPDFVRSWKGTEEKEKIYYCRPPPFQMFEPSTSTAVGCSYFKNSPGSKKSWRQFVWVQSNQLVVIKKVCSRSVI